MSLWWKSEAGSIYPRIQPIQDYMAGQAQILFFVFDKSNHIFRSDYLNVLLYKKRISFNIYPFFGRFIIFESIA